MKGSNKRGKYVLLEPFMFSTCTSSSTYQNISIIRVVWSIIFSLNNPDSIVYYISTILIFALRSNNQAKQNQTKQNLLLFTCIHYVC